MDIELNWQMEYKKSPDKGEVKNRKTKAKSMARSKHMEQRISINTK